MDFTWTPRLKKISGEGAEPVVYGYPNGRKKAAGGRAAAGEKDSGFRGY